MTVFDTKFGTYSAPKLLVEWGEPIVYVPRDGTPRDIEAIIDRNPPETIGGAGVRGPRFTAQVTNDVLLGITSDELNTGGDKLEFPPRVGQAAKSYPIQKLLTDAGDMLLLEVY